MNEWKISVARLRNGRFQAVAIRRHNGRVDIINAEADTPAEAERKVRRLCGSKLSPTAGDIGGCSPTS